MLPTSIPEHKTGLNRFNHASGVAVITPTDRPKSARNRCVIESFGGVFMLSLCILGISFAIKAPVIRRSYIVSFLL